MGQSLASQVARARPRSMSVQASGPRQRRGSLDAEPLEAAACAVVSRVASFRNHPEGIADMAGGVANRSPRCGASVGELVPSVARRTVRRRAGGRSLVLVPEGDPALAEVVRRELDAHLVPGEDPDSVLAHLARHVRDDAVAVVEPDPEPGVREHLVDYAFHFDRIFLGHAVAFQMASVDAAGTSPPIVDAWFRGR